MTKPTSLLALSLLASLITLAAVSAQQTNPPPAGGSWNPYLVQGLVTPAPMLPVEFNGTGSLIFDVGNTGSSDIVWVGNQPMLLTISLSYGLPNVTNPADPAQAITVVTGPGAEWFSWEYFPAQNTFRGTQKATIPGNSRRTIQIAYKVTQNSFGALQNGYNVNISPPAYTNPQPTDDDTVAAYTRVEAFDYSDAPLGFPTVSHKVELTKNLQNRYTAYMYLGTSIDPENASQPSPVSSGDDKSQTGGLNTNDENGVVFPVMTPGATVAVPVTVTLRDWDPENPTAEATLRCWIDWNKDAIFKNNTPNNERLLSFDVNQYLAEELGETAWTGARSFLIPFTVTVPANASGTYQARFRFGPTVAPDGPPASAPGVIPVVEAGIASHGEVEDYMFFVGTTSGTVTGRLYHDMNGNAVKDGAEPYLPNISVTVTDANSNPQTVVTDANGYWSALVPAGAATVDIIHTDPDVPAGTVLPAGADPRSVTILSLQDIDGGTVGFAPSGYPTWQSANSTSGAMDQDHDQDGVSNGIEYFLVGPQANSTGYNSLPSVQKQGEVMSITWTKATTYAGTYATHFVVETSTNLQNPWTAEPLGTRVTLNGNQITYTFPQPYLTRQFVRLRVSGP